MALTTEQKEIWNTFKLYYDSSHIRQISFDDENKLNLTGDVQFLMGSSGLNVKFGEVKGMFNVSSMGLKSLEGAPTSVTEVFSVARNSNLESLKGGPIEVGEDYTAYSCKLTNLIGAPKKVGGAFMVFKNPLTSLEGCPDHIAGTMSLDYEPDLPLLRTLVALHVDFTPGQAKVSWDKVIQCHDILNKYAGQGKRAMFDCQKDLEDAGFEENARW
jgi:hypothetical protein